MTAPLTCVQVPVKQRLCLVDKLVLEHRDRYLKQVL